MTGAAGSGSAARKGGLSAPPLGLTAQFPPRGYFCQNEQGRRGVVFPRGLGLDPVEHGRNVMNLCAGRNWGAVDHDDRNSQPARCDKFRLGPCSAGILGDDKADVMGLHQGCVRVRIKRAAVKDDVMVGQGGRGLRRIDEAQKVAVLRMAAKGSQMHASQCEHDVFARPVQRGHGGGNIWHPRPLIAVPCGPWRPRQRQQGRLCAPRRLNGICADRCGEGVGCVDKMGDLGVAQIGCKPLRAAKTPYAHRHRLGFGAFDAPCIAERGRQPCGGKRCDKARCLDRAAKNEDIRHG